MIELLAPAGSPSALKAAVEAGADAVYMGSNWNARLRARNFTREELAKAISYCHNNNVKAYIALNTLIFEEEIKGVKEYLEFLDKNEADAIIVQDLGVVRLARELNFSFDIHASTQMSVHNSNTAKLLKERGIKRIILARELTFDQIKRIKEN
ncbi:MAG: peptidase U32 family protein, partial [Nitrososphaerota archaeon]